ncbi:MAG: hypothetical protein ACI910_000881 [Oleispira sp.]|jgi:hypothetical protein
MTRLCMPIHDKVSDHKPTRLLVIVTCLWAILLPSSAMAECRDGDAIEAADQKAVSYFKKGEVFHRGVVHKIHHPSRKKEVASYIKVDKKRYSMIMLVDQECDVQFRKRTRQQD